MNIMSLNRAIGKELNFMFFTFPGFTNVISSSETDNFLSSCAAHTDLKGKELGEAFKRMNQVDAAAIVGRWLFSVDQDLAMRITRSECGLSERRTSLSSRRYRSTEASEHHDSCAFEGSSPPGSQPSTSGLRGPCPCPRHRSDSSDHFGYFDFPRVAGAGSDGDSVNVSCRHMQRRICHESKLANTSMPLEALSCEEYQRSLSDQLVLQPRSWRLFDPCQGCQHCASILPQQETRGPKSCNSEKESPASATDADDDSVSVSVQVSSAADDESSKDLSLSTAETGEPHEKASFPFRSELTELSSRLSLSWRPVARELGFGTTELCQFEETSLLRVQASRMLEDWLSKSRCRLGCKNCEESILEALGEAFENAHRADLKDFVEHSRKK